MVRRAHRPTTSAMVAAAVTLAAAACSTTAPDSRADEKSRLSQSTGATTPSRAQFDPALAGPLLRAAADDDAARVGDLIARGADIETRGEQGRTPLIAATKNRAGAAARVLVDAGADVNAKDAIQDSAYLYAGAEGIDDILDLTLRHGADLGSVNRFGGTALIPASERGHVDTVQRLIEAGVDVDHVNNLGWTALLEAVVYGDGSDRYQQVVTALLDGGADPSIKDGNGRTALDNAETRGQTAIVAILDQHRPR